MKITTAQLKGPRPYQEDYYTVLQDESFGTLLAVFDGHGGDRASDCCAEVLEIIYATNKGIFKEFNDITMQNIFKELNFYTENMDEGTTASIVHINPLMTTATVGILGDSPVLIWGRDSFNVSPEHNARSNEAERNAAIARGADYYNGYIYDFETARANCMSWTKAKGLQMTRALGDKLLGKVLNREPEIYTVPVGRGSHIVVGSDGMVDPSHLNGKTNEAMQWLTYDITLGLDANALMGRVENYGLKDNVTIISAVLED